MQVWLSYPNLSLDMQVQTSYPNLSWVISIYETCAGISRYILRLTCPGVCFPDALPYLGYICFLLGKLILFTGSIYSVYPMCRPTAGCVTFCIKYAYSAAAADSEF